MRAAGENLADREWKVSQDVVKAHEELPRHVVNSRNIVWSAARHFILKENGEFLVYESRDGIATLKAARQTLDAAKTAARDLNNGRRVS